jgi:ABC-2 type transport system permease protein
MRALIHLVKKELLILLRDWHALLLLFALPTLFILIMSLALRDRFSVHSAASLSYYLVNADPHPIAKSVVAALEKNKNFKILDASSMSEAELLKLVQHDRAQFLISIPEGFGKSIASDAPKAAQVAVGPAVEPAAYRLFEAAVREAVSKVVLEDKFLDLKAQLSSFSGSSDLGFDMDLSFLDKLVERRSLYESGRPELLPTSVQQNVPAWLVFAMFFIALPLSTTWVQERGQGTFARLRSMGVARRWLLLGKLLPYYLINLLQVLLMLGVGVWLVPLFGGDRLTLGHAPLALALMAMAASFASVAWALLVANLVSTAEQATIFTGVSTLVLGALGGVMVPRFIMPITMQHLSQFSPLAWGLDGFLELFLKNGGLADVLPHAAKLFAFGLLSLLLAAYRLGKRRGI